MNRIRRMLLGSVGVLAVAGPGFAQPRAGRTFRVAWAGGDGAGMVPLFIAFRDRLAERGFVAGRNLELRAFQRRSANRTDLLQEMLAWNPDVIQTFTAEGTKRVQKATSSIPIVFAMVPDPVSTGLVASIVRPGGNATGVAQAHDELAIKRVELVRELWPRARRIAVLFDSRAANLASALAAVAHAADRAKLVIESFDAASHGGVPGALSPVARSMPDAMMIVGVLFTEDAQYYNLLFPFQERTRIPILDDSAEAAEFGLFLGLGEDIRNVMRRCADIAAKILLGARPSDIPVDTATHVQLWVNTAAARRLGIDIPQSVLARADRVIDK